MLVHFLSRVGRDRAPEARFLGLWVGEGKDGGRERKPRIKRNMAVNTS